MSISYFIKRQFFLISAFLCLLINLSFAQGNIEKYFYYETLQFPTDSTTSNRIDTYIAIPYQYLVFVKEDEIFYSEYEITIAIFQDQQLIKEETKNFKVREPSYQKTISNVMLNTVKFTFYLPPKNYIIQIQVQDKIVNRPIVREITLQPKNYHGGSIQFSDILLMRKAVFDSTEEMRPNITDFFKNDFVAYVEFVAPKDIEVVKINYNILNIRDNEVREGSTEISLKQSKKGCIFEIDGSEFPPGRYRIRIWAEEKSVPVEKLFHIIRSKTFVYVNEEQLDKAIEQLEYIAKWTEVRDMQAMPFEEKKTQFNKFWEKWDPTPVTKKNELMEEYYGRIDFANEKFSSSREEGWESDRGEIYVTYGAADRTEHRDSRTPEVSGYEIWHYDNLNRQFIFENRGFGDYVLIRTY